MPRFVEIQTQLTLGHEAWRDEIWTVYHLEAHPFARSRFDWGPAYLYRFHDVAGAALAPRWLALYAAVREALARGPALRRRVELVPFAATGDDFLVQAKPPYDGGYSTRRYGDFLQHGDCIPNRDLLVSLAYLHAAVIQDVRLGDHDPGSNEELLARIMHATLVRPYGQLFWGDVGKPWWLYYPAITREDLDAWRTVERGSP